VDWNKVDGENLEVDSRDKVQAYRKQRSVIRNEDDVGARASVYSARDEERVLRSGMFISRRRVVSCGS